MNTKLLFVRFIVAIDQCCECICLGFTFYINVNSIMKFIYTQCKCIRSIYICIIVKVEHKTCKCKIM